MAIIANYQQQQQLSSSQRSSSTTTTTTNNGGAQRSILCSASSSLSRTPRFSFNFVDDASLGTLSNSRRSTYSRPTHHNNQSRHRSNAGKNNALSPTRLDARYSSRLPPSYGHSPNNAGYARSLWFGAQVEAGIHLVGVLYLIAFSVALADVGGAGCCVTVVTK